MRNLAWQQIISYMCSLIFVFGVVVRVFRYSKMPIHLRWELHPMALEEERPYGGSPYEELEWWQKPREKNLMREACYIGKEILFFRQVFKRNKGLWYFGYPLHLGFYLYFIWLLLLSFETIAIPGSMAGPAESHTLFNRMFDFLTLGAGIAGFILGAIGAIGLLVKRMAEENLRLYTCRIDYFNLLFIAAVFISGLWGWWSADRSFLAVRHYLWSLFTFNRAFGMNTATTLHILLASTFFAYMPFTTMMHYIAKYFNFHKVLWDDEPNLRGGEVERKLKNVLNKKVTWLAPHVSSGRRWRELTQIEKEDSSRKVT